MHDALDWMPVLPATTELGLESFETDLTQSQDPTQNQNPWFRPVNITIENGVIYATIYACHACGNATLKEQLLIWLMGLKETDRVILSVSLMYGVSMEQLTPILMAIMHSPAQIDILCDQVAMGEVAYFYLAAKKVIPRSCGALFIPSYLFGRPEDMSGVSKAILDFYETLVDRAQENGILTEEEAAMLHQGGHVSFDSTRFLD